MSPFPNEHSCRLANPDEVKVVGSLTRDHKGKNYRILVGKRAGKSGSEAQAYRYPKSEWTEEAARAHCKDAGGSFEAASKETQHMEPEDYLNPAENPLIPQPNEEALTKEFLEAQKAEEEK
jgi:hypothetical protein